MSDSKNDKKVEVIKGEEALLLNHNYDGIHEFDHPLPRWWLGILYATIAFAVWYMGYYMVGGGPTPQEETAAALKEIEALRPAANPAADSAALLAAYKDPEKLKLGATIYATNCLVCHADKGQGLIGPNLTDEFWINGTGTLADVANVVINGVLDKGMPAWGNVLKPEDLQNVVAYVHSIHGTNPTGAKPPQGNKQDFKD